MMEDKADLLSKKYLITHGNLCSLNFTLIIFNFHSNLLELLVMKFFQLY